MNAAQYKDDVLTLLFMKYVSGKAAAVDLDKLRVAYNSVPGNPLLAESLY